MDKNQNKKIKKNALEWTVFGFSVLLTLTILGYLVYDAITFKPSPPDLVVEYHAEKFEKEETRYMYKVINKGGETAEDIKLKVILARQGEVLEEFELDIPFLPRNSDREGWIKFQERPLPSDSVKMIVVGFLKP